MRDGRALKDVIDAIDLICKHGGRARPSAGATFAEFVERYLSGAWADQYLPTSGESRVWLIIGHALNM